MATEINLQTISVEAGSDLSAKQYLAVKVNTSGQLAVAVGDDYAIGILQDDPAAAGRPGIVGIAGVVKGTAGGTVTKGDRLVVDSASKLVTATGQAQHVAIAIESAAVNEIFKVYWLGSEQNQVKSIISIPVTLANITAAGDVVTNYTPGFNGKVLKFSACVTTAVTTGAKLATLNLEIGTVNVTGGSLALTSANCTPLGAVVDATAITAANTFTATDTLSVEAASVTAFVEGAIVLFIVLG